MTRTVISLAVSAAQRQKNTCTAAAFRLRAAGFLYLAYRKPAVLQGTFPETFLPTASQVV